MPLYDFGCPKGHKFEVFLPLRNFNDPQVCGCGLEARRLISVPFIQPDISGYTSPIDGKWIGSRAQRREDLKRNNCVEWDTGMKEEQMRRQRAAEDKLDKAIDETVEAEIHGMGARKRDKLISELENGVTAGIVRT